MEAQNITAKLDGEGPGHVFRGNQHVTQSHESRGAVHASMRAKRAEQKGSAKEQRTAHRAAAHAHKAAGAFAKGSSKAYHQTMARFHGARGKSSFKMDSAVLDAADFAALRATVAGASGVMARLAAAQAIHAARAAPAVAAMPDAGVIAGYLTPSGKVGLQISRFVFGDRVTYSYTGEYGAGSGADTARLVQVIAQTKQAKPRMKLGWGTDIVNINAFLAAPVMSQSQAQYANWTSARAEAAGAVAAGNGDPRMTPVDFPSRLARDWLTGWDNAKTAASDDETPLRTRGDIALDALKSMGWTVSKWGPDVLVRSFVGMGRIGTVTVPDGTRNVYARVTDGELVVKFGDDTIASASLAGTDAEVEATAGTVNATVEAFAAAESERANPKPAYDPVKEMLTAAGFTQSPSMPNNYVKAVLADDGKVKHLYSIREFGPLGTKQYRVTRSTSFPGTGVTGAPTQDMGTFDRPELAISAVHADMEIRLKKEPAPAADDGPKFRYALMNRPADFATVPKGLTYTVEPRPAAGQPHHDMARHGILVTDRELTAAECKAFELAPLVDGADLGVLAEKVAASMAEYANSYIEMATEEPASFRSMVMQSVESAASGISYSIGDPDALVQMVLDKLKASIPAAIVMPEPTVTPPATDPVREADVALLSMVAAGTHPDMLEPELADQIEAVLMRYPDDADIQAAGEKAINAYGNAMMAATEKL